MRDLTALVHERAGGGEPLCLYAYDLAALRTHLGTVVGALPEPCRMYYAVKANSAAPLLAAAADHVHGFEVASGGELAKVRAAAPATPVLMGGPVPTPAEIRAGLAAGVARFHVESLLGLHRVSREAVAAGATAEVLLRVNLAGPFPTATLAMAGRPTQFGVDESDLDAVVTAATTLPGIRLTGFHLHSLSNNLSHTDHLEMLALYRDTVLGWERRHGLRCSVVDVGGGIGVDYSDLDTPFDWDAFTRGLHDWVDTLPPHWTEIDFECGRFLVARCGAYAVEVLDVKRNHGQAYALVRGGTHQFRLPSSWQHSHPFQVVPVERWDSGLPRPELVDEHVTVCGELCTPKDVLAAEHVARIRPGDVLVFEAAGAYGWEISHHDFLSHGHPEHLWLD
ncbi:diaminopimelate decarboxylase (plasmid) [Pseudonocardia sp. EC080610-09]|uniref:alanine racemase n=1 Tax=unclassified Pseudonocardia TaxID=2619320 RepID=UPI0007058F4E|nr:MULTISPECIES: alanine racemase [unclassified Pseudonocardia]ALL79341.1 diaminopimelate decarboxylase [Pseudonocardia sp. EC080610-09]ALL85312.1 diaminopimelate decarboxylase [Pseudonocardia sp. EC080619-01]